MLGPIVKGGSVWMEGEIVSESWLKNSHDWKDMNKGVVYVLQILLRGNITWRGKDLVNPLHSPPKNNQPPLVPLSNNVKRINVDELWFIFFLIKPDVIHFLPGATVRGAYNGS